MRVQASIPVLKVEKSRLAHIEISGSRADGASTMNPISTAQGRPIFRGALI
jgi:hypothetical protein